MDELPLVWCKCDYWVQYGGQVKINQVRLDLSNGSAYTLYEGEYYWSPIYKKCCTFAYDEKFAQIIETHNNFPHIKVQ